MISTRLIKEAPVLISSAIRSGLITVTNLDAEYKRQLEERRRRNREATRKWRAAKAAAGDATKEGKKRQRPYQWLTGMTPEQKRERRQQQSREWNWRKRAERHAAGLNSNGKPYKAFPLAYAR